MSPILHPFNPLFPPFSEKVLFSLRNVPSLKYFPGFAEASWCILPGFLPSLSDGSYSVSFVDFSLSLMSTVAFLRVHIVFFFMTFFHNTSILEDVLLIIILRCCLFSWIRLNVPIFFFFTCYLSYHLNFNTFLTDFITILISKLFYPSISLSIPVNESISLYIRLKTNFDIISIFY